MRRVDTKTMEGVALCNFDAHAYASAMRPSPVLVASRDDDSAMSSSTRTAPAPAQRFSEEFFRNHLRASPPLPLLSTPFVVVTVRDDATPNIARNHEFLEVFFTV
ncbi:hypothetical protein CDAR_319111 [Caerostris darwini]|uniref:Uncharacterized protein n=1 Tax=Caerostris darwini TaxID=1538125 RepID=A0AAV4TYW7_9ARAC|nr:hypothetical protein CDAR_319111 [Caerostris darwini]